MHAGGNVLAFTYDKLCSLEGIPGPAFLLVQAAGVDNTVPPFLNYPQLFTLTPPFTNELIPSMHAATVP